MLPTDDVLVAGLRAGDEQMFVLLLGGWSDSMLRLARSFVSTTASAEEVVQDTWLAVFQGVDGFQARSSLKTWVYRILVNTARKRGAREDRTVPWASVADAPAAHPSRGPSTENEVLAREVRTVVAAAVAGLPPRQQVVLTLRDIDGHSADEVCDLLQISTANQRVLLHRARTAVRNRLEQYYRPTAQLTNRQPPLKPRACARSGVMYSIP
jgi:RNA polymerase sigma-70 factor (ECF subfamily)